MKLKILKQIILPPGRLAGLRTMSMGYWKTAQNVQRSMVAHAVADSPSDKALFENAMVLEADWGLGRNSLNIIYMTTADNKPGKQAQY